MIIHRHLVLPHSKQEPLLQHACWLLIIGNSKTFRAGELTTSSQCLCQKTLGTLSPF